MRFIAAFFALLLSAAAPAMAQGFVFRNVVIDTSPIAAQGYPTFAHRVEAAVAPAVASAFASRVNPGDPRGLTLVFRVFDVQLTLANGTNESENDFMRAEGLAVDGQGRVVARVGIVAPAIAWTTVASLPVEVEEQRRMRTLGLNAANWLRNRL